MLETSPFNSTSGSGIETSGIKWLTKKNSMSMMFQMHSDLMMNAE